MTLREPAFDERSADWLEPADALRRILEGCEPLPCEDATLAESLGRALAEDVHSEVALPPWDNAAMDGYAVRGEDVAGAGPSSPVAFRVRALTRAGAAPAGAVGPGEAVRIMTGAPLPHGADTVVRVEDTDAEVLPGRVLILHDRDRYRNVRPGGADMRPGDLVLRRGDGIHPGTVGALAALGRERVRVHRRPSVAILTTGDELRGPERYADVRAGGGIPESNGPMLAAQTAAAGGVPMVLGIVPDDAGALLAAVEQAARSDVLVTVGGASMGEADLVKRALERAGFRQDFWRVRMRPGSPFGFGWLPRPGGAQPVFGLPGNPASAFVTFELFVRPFLLRMGGHRSVHRRRIRCRAGEGFPGGERTGFLRVRLEAGPDGAVARSTGPQASGLVRGLASAQGLAIVAPGPGVAEGEAVDVILLDAAPGATHVSPLEAPGP
ncbi:MAG: molybdopterin molybdotransferase MoeA [Longimicrobiales bacterium]